MPFKKLAVAIGLLLAAGSPAIGYDFVRESYPNRWLEPYLPETLPKLEYPSYFTAIDEARELAFKGRYKASLIRLRSVKNADPTEVSLIKATSLSAIGRNDEALAVLTSKDARALILRAQIFAKLGRFDEARATLQSVIAINPESIPARFYAAQFAEAGGDMAAAEAGYAWFNDDKHRFVDKWKSQPDAAPFDSAENTVLIGRALDRLSMIKGFYRDNRQLHDVILGLFVKAYDVIDRNYWPAHVAAAEYFLSHDQQKEAGQELLQALAANPNDAEALLVGGEMAIDQYDFDRGDRATDALRRVDASSTAADLLECRNLLRQRQPKDAEELTRKVLSARPKDIEAMGLLAGSLMLQLRDDEAKAVLKQVESVDPDNASAYYEVAEQLGAMRQYARSAAMYQVAIDREPWWVGAQNSLGLLYTQSGQEDKAHTVLDAAHSLDPFNLRTTNYLRLLDEMAAYGKSETAHFTVRYDQTLDPVIPEYFGEYLETIYPKVTARYHAIPPEKTVIEVFPTHEEFSVRTTGSPWIGTVGASTGPVIALVSPRKGPGTMGPFNWSQVLHHEFTHTVTLAATDNRIAHWMTEGLAVVEEESPMPWDWVPMLYHAVKQKELFPLDKLTWAFIRPKRAMDKTLGYAESYWICQYIERNFGEPAILKMLDGFKAGEPQEKIFKEVLNKTETEFFGDFEKWAELEVAKWGYDADTSKEYDDLRKAADASIKARQYAEAAATWEQIVKLRPMDAMPHQRLAGLYLTKDLDNKPKAIEHLVALSKVDLKDNRYAKRVARLYRDAGDMANAQSYAKRAVYIDPYDPDAHDLLEEISEKSGDAQSAAREKRVIPVLAKWIEENRKRSDITD